jgi:hypothetical protein
LGNAYDLYPKHGRLKDAVAAYTEALEIYRALVSEDPRANLPGLARVLYNFADLYLRSDHEEEAAPLCAEGRAVLSQLSSEYPDLYSGRLRTLCSK